MIRIFNRRYLFFLVVLLLASLACQGSDTEQPPAASGEGEVSEDPQSPSASFLVDVDSGSAPLVVEFNNISQGPATSVEWDFGDGTTSTNLSPVHRYTLAGTYDVKLTVSGPGGNHVSGTQLITVEPGPVARVEVEPSEVTLGIEARRP